ncbi:site-specific integrase [Sphingomonas sp.]|uniref:tyrosine-type recombinase/integrase n=1 Tax=Sphingomonas sp. TaxID=28214 RepID=UPI00180CBDFF|nr:site-specific integrase [Sphingomonas sp.]MBA3510850.1 tyrosine-type recombinase/integrase [Sphingomonas sp.]
MGKLTALAVKAALPIPGTYQDGDGLFLKVDKRGGASWTLRVQRDRKRQDIGLGSARLLTLADARDKANALRKAIKVQRRDLLAEKKDEAAAKVTFRDAARQYHTENKAGWKSSIYARQWLASLENYAFPQLGSVSTDGVMASDIITVLTPIWQEIPETARQVRNRICAVLDYAHAKGWRSTEAPSGNGSLKAGRGLPRQVKDRVNRKAMPDSAVPSFLAALRRKPSYGRLALEFLVLTGVRSQEVRLATWDEIDLEGRLWTIPVAHMKRSKAHMVPLSDAALAVLAKAAALKLAGTDQVFPGAGGGPMSDMTLLKVLRDMSEPYHVHGFRSALTDWAANEGYPDAVVEAALAHKTPDAVQAAYRRTTYLGSLGQPGQRVKLMAEWGRYCTSEANDCTAVVPFRKAKGGK